MQIVAQSYPASPLPRQTGPRSEGASQLPSAKEESTQADAKGGIQGDTSKSGLYLVTAHHREQVSGFSAGKAYERISYKASVSWRQP